MTGARVSLSINHRLLRTLKDLGRPDAPESVAAAKVLESAVRSAVPKPGEVGPVKRGEKPRRQKGKVLRGQVGATQRVGLTSYEGPLSDLGEKLDKAVRSAREGMVKKYGDAAKRRLRS